MMCRWSNPAQLHYRHRLPSIQLATKSALQVNQLAHSQVAKNSYRVVRRTLPQSSNGAHTLAVEPVFRFQPTKVDEGFADLLFFIRSQFGHFVGIIGRNRVSAQTARCQRQEAVGTSWRSTPCQRGEVCVCLHITLHD